jgi:hypothetical protein
MTSSLLESSMYSFFWGDAADDDVAAEFDRTDDSPPRGGRKGVEDGTNASDVHRTTNDKTRTNIR